MSGEEGEGKGFKVVDRRGATDEAKPADEAPPVAAAEPPRAEAGARGDGAKAEGPLPEIDFATFVLSLASSALMHLGELARPGETRRRDLGLAKQTIDILGMLDDKTRGNLNAEEAKLVEHLLYDLRLKYVEAKKKG